MGEVGVQGARVSITHNIIVIDTHYTYSPVNLQGIQGIPGPPGEDGGVGEGGLVGEKVRICHYDIASVFQTLINTCLTY